MYFDLVSLWKAADLMWAPRPALEATRLGRVPGPAPRVDATWPALVWRRGEKRQARRSIHLPTSMTACILPFTCHGREKRQQQGPEKRGIYGILVLVGEVEHFQHGRIKERLRCVGLR